MNLPLLQSTKYDSRHGLTGICAPERKIRCDLHRPTCVNCSKALQSCKGYGMQLSWPREGDKRRALVHHSAATVARLPERYRERGLLLLNTSSWDVALSDTLQGNRNPGKQYTCPTSRALPDSLADTISPRTSCMGFESILFAAYFTVSCLGG
jgi:hypothetical protein